MESGILADKYIDFNIYLFEAIITWCKHVINNYTPLVNKFLSPYRLRIIPDWYRRLLNEAQAHVKGGKVPTFNFASKPRKQDGWIV
jgi:hypothetical protein